MPGSVRENDDDVREFVTTNGIATVLDVGAGRGTYSRMLRRLPGLVLDAVEVWQPYVEHYALTDRYRDVRVGDVRDMTPDDFAGYDLVIFGDVLEHMKRAEALAVWERAARSATFGLISVPIVHYPQGPQWENPYEEHVQDHLTPEAIRTDYGPFCWERCYAVTGTFVAYWGEHT